jgi:hypothetical protein
LPAGQLTLPEKIVQSWGSGGQMVDLELLD